MDAERPVVAEPLDGTDVHTLSDGTRRDTTLTPAGDAADRQQRFAAGLTWNVAYQALEVALSFGSMLLLVRIIAPGDYGRAAVVVGILGMLGTLDAHLFLEQALQLPEGQTPDWSLHWTFSFYLQGAIALVCEIVAALCWLSPSYIAIAKLLHLAGFGLFFQAGNALGATMLRRDLDFRRLKLVAAGGMSARLLSTLVLGLAGGGAYAIVFGSNVVAAMPFAVDLFLIRGWRPDPGWWRRFDRRRHAEAIRFGLQRTAGGLVGGIRDGVEAAILPGAIGFVGIGLVNRAQALYGTTVGRLGTVLADTVYPFLPREKHNRERYASQATLYLQVMSFIAVPGALFIGRYGALLSRVLYGNKWAAADPLIWPAALIGLGLALFGVSSEILLASGALRTCLMLDFIAAVSVLPALGAAWTTRLALPYAWTVAGVQFAIALLALVWASPLLQRGWWRAAVAPAVVAATAGLGAGWMLPLAGQRPKVQLAIQAAVFVAAAALSLRIFFRAVLEQLILRVPAGRHLRRVLFLTPPSPAVQVQERPNEL